MYDFSAVATAFALSLFAGLSTGLGGLIVALKRDPNKRFLASALGFSSGVMVYISLMELLPEGIASLEEAGNPRAELYGVLAFFAGVAVIAVIDRLVPEDINPHEDHRGAKAAGDATAAADSKTAATGVTTQQMRNVGLLTALAIAIHNFPEGFATFIVALEDPVVALPIALAIAIHNIPEGIAVAVPLREATGKKWRAAGWAALSGLAEPLGAAVGFLLLMPFIGPQALGLTFAAIAGVMVFVSLDELLPTAVATGRHHDATYGIIAGMAVMAVSLLILPS